MNRPDSKSPPIALIANARVHVDGERFEHGDQINSELSSVLDLLQQGKVVLNPAQSEPPFELIDHAASFLQHFDRLGPVCRTPATLSRAQDELLKGERRNAMINGREIRWFYQSLRRCVLPVLCGAESHDLTPFHQINPPFQRVFHDPRRRINSDDEVSAEDIRSRGLITFPQSADVSRDPRVGYEYVEVGESWFQYWLCLRDLSNKIDDVLQLSLEEGRVLALDFFDNQAGLLPPEHWSRQRFDQAARPNLHFVLSGDLPSQWFNKGTGPKNNRDIQLENTAKRDLEDRYQARLAGGPSVTKAEFIESAKTKYGLSKNRAADVWKGADIPDWKKPGRRPER